MECNVDQNLANCNCSYEPCSRKGKRCECIIYHWSMKQLPACLFPDDVEATYDRSLKEFLGGLPVKASSPPRTTDPHWQDAGLDIL